MSISFQQSQSFKEQELASALAWHRANNPKLSERELGIFSAGFEQGFGKAMSAAVFHGVERMK